MITPENKVWRAVLGQAYADAEMPSTGSGFEPYERVRARGYLRADGAESQASLRLVCDFADVPADRVVIWARKRYPQSPELRRRERRHKTQQSSPVSEISSRAAS